MEIPPILYGTAWKKERTAALVAAALGAGFRGIDTACQPKHYDEAGVGDGVAAAGVARDELYLQTKFTPVDGHDSRRIPYDPAAPVAAQVRRSFEVSLANLRTDRLDCLLLHSPLREPAQTAEAWQALERIVDEGGARRIGISNCYDPAYLARLHASVRIKPAVVQNRFYAATGYDREIRAFCRAEGIVYQSFWTLTANPHLLAAEEIRAPARRHGRTPEQVLFRYLTQVGVVPLTGTTSAVHMREDLAIFEFELGADEIGRITAIVG